jgi:hypothetical protein
MQQKQKWHSWDDVCIRYHAGRTSIQRQVKNGTLPPPVQLAPATKRFADGELDDIDRLRLAGGNDEDAQKRVRELIAARKQPRERAA